MVRKILLLFFALSIMGCAADFAKKTPEMVQHIKGSVFKATEKGYYTAELVMKPKQPVVGKNSAHLIIHDYEGNDTPGLTITVRSYMTDKDVESNGRPVVKDAGRGLYILENIFFDSPGKWELRLKISGPRMYDSVVLPLPEVKEKS